jgi:hypothetical protein
MAGFRAYPVPGKSLPKNPPKRVGRYPMPNPQKPSGSSPSGGGSWSSPTPPEFPDNHEYPAHTANAQRITEAQNANRVRRYGS